MAIGWDQIGDLNAYSSKDEMKQAMKEEIDPSKPYTNAAHATWQFVHDMKPGDVVFAKKGMRDGYLLEGMACPGGCIAGAGTITPVKVSAANIAKYKAEAEKQSSIESVFANRLHEAEE